jgi:hypothetical protein
MKRTSRPAQNRLETSVFVVLQLRRDKLVSINLRCGKQRRREDNGLFLFSAEIGGKQKKAIKSVDEVTHSSKRSYIFPSLCFSKISHMLCSLSINIFELLIICYSITPIRASRWRPLSPLRRSQRKSDMSPLFSSPPSACHGVSCVRFFFLPLHY